MSNTTINSSQSADNRSSFSQAVFNQTQPLHIEDDRIDALLYIIVVLFFYAFSIVILMVKYIRRENVEADLRTFYFEFVSRDKFHSAQVQNKLKLEQMLETNDVVLKSHFKKETDIVESAVVSCVNELCVNSMCSHVSDPMKEVNGDPLTEVNSAVAKTRITTGSAAMLPVACVAGMCKYQSSRWIGCDDGGLCSRLETTV